MGLRSGLYSLFLSEVVGGVSFKFPPHSFKDALRLDVSTTLRNSSFRGIDYQEGDAWGNPEA